MAPQTTQAALREQLGDTLVSQLTNVSKESDPAQFVKLCADVRRALRNAKTGTATSMFEMDGIFKGLIQKAKIRSQDDLAEALDHTYSALQNDIDERQPLEPGIKMATLPDHLQFLILLSLPPTPATHTYASMVLDKEKDPFRVPSALTWETIMAEEPFEGDHWKIAGPDSRSRKGKRRANSWSSSESLDEVSDEDRSPSSSSSPPTTHASTGKRADDKDEFVSSSELAAAHAQMQLDEMLDRQYWKDHWRIDVDLDEPFDLSKSETLGPTFMKVSGGTDMAAMRLAGPNRGLFINEVDAVREVLLALQSLDNTLLVLRSGKDRGPPTVEVRPSALRPVHLTSGTYFSLLTTFASAAALPTRLQHFLGTIGCRHTGRTRKPLSLTAEAFSEAVDIQIREFRSWCSAKEQVLCAAQGGVGPSLAVSLLSLSREVEERIAVLQSLLKVTDDVQQKGEVPREEFDLMDDDLLGTSPATFASQLLDLLFSSYKSQYSMGNEGNAKKLLEIFLATAQPIWHATITWIREGRPGEVDYQEDGVISVDSGDFFILHDVEVPMLDASWWSSAYRFHAMKEAASIPAFLHSIGPHILAAGKAEALLMNLGISSGDICAAPRLSEVVGLSNEELWEPRDLEAAVQGHLTPSCLVAQQKLYAVVVDTCRMWHHLKAIEDIFLFRQGDLMDDFAGLLFDRLDNRHTWFDYHVINAAFRDFVTRRPDGNIEPSLVRFWYTKPREDAAARMTKCLSGLSVTYEVPIPLLYLLTPDALQTYSTIFVLLLQLRRAKRLIDGIIVRRGLGAELEVLHSSAADDIKAFFALRSKLSWFLNTFTYFLYTTVIQSQLQTFHASLKTARTLDDMITVHQVHLERLSARCLLSESTISLHKALINALDISLQFGDCYAALSGEASVNPARRTAGMQDRKKRRTRRQRRQLRKRNFVGFSEDIPTVADEDSSDSDVEDEPGVTFADESMSFGGMLSFVDEPLASRLDRMSSEMDRMVRYLRRGAEKLASEGGPDTAVFEVLAFSLEDWDL